MNEASTTVRLISEPTEMSKPRTISTLNCAMVTSASGAVASRMWRMLSGVRKTFDLPGRVSADQRASAAARKASGTHQALHASPSETPRPRDKVRLSRFDSSFLGLRLRGDVPRREERRDDPLLGDLASDEFADDAAAREDEDAVAEAGELQRVG